jgi:vancomycin permeability regulator SanA
VDHDDREPLRPLAVADKPVGAQSKRATSWTPIQWVAAMAVVFLVWCAALTAIGTHDHLGKAALIVIPATAVRPDGSLSHRLRARCDRGAQAYRDGLGPMLFVSGGMDRNGHDEAAFMKRYLLARGVPARAIISDSLGVDSWETVVHARAWLEAHRQRGLLLVSQGFHLPRLRLACARLGLRPVYWVHARFWEPRDLFSIARELPGLVKYALRPS